VARAEVEAAYFALLRAREELDNLRRYEEFLRAEGQRLRRTTREGQALLDQVDRRLARAIRHTDQPLTDAIDARLRVLAEELARVPDRIDAAQAFVEECERDHAALKHGS
jgi:hypothetical protein